MSINVTGGADIAAYQVTVNFDPTALSYFAGKNAEYLPAGSFEVPPIVNAGSVTIAAASLAGAASHSDGTLATITFAVVEPKESTISLTNAEISNTAANALPVTTIDSTIIFHVQ